MKKKYMKPEMEAIDIKPQGILCGSITQNETYLNIILMTDDEFGSDETIN